MSYLSTKILPLFIYPLGLAITLGILALLLLWAGRKKTAAAAITTAIAILWITSTPRFSDFMMASLEQHYPPVHPANIPTAQAIVILGGVTSIIKQDTRLYDLGDGADRLFHGARLYKAGKAPLSCCLAAMKKIMNRNQKPCQRYLNFLA